ncbi:hypothetical protein GGR34_000708 [Microvirga flocculans]|uniref:Uncharacterized protein n=1 Tax=Microvirga flocculans TaxID=217168 RepID=A0A7W6N6K2_9HYPH|nr:hypothetical protein [Microvirga flocculans]MBB4039073.1 hypothetical protein [Microvirga flocculans]
MTGMTRAGRLAAIMLTAALGACQSSFSGSPEGIPVALESIDGAPAPIRTALADELANAATDRKVELVGATAEARYRVRGYLSTSTEDGETRLAYVWDVFDSQKRRAKRLEGSRPVPASSISSLDKEALAKLAQASMDEIARFLSASKSEPAASDVPAMADAPLQTAEAQPAAGEDDENKVAMQ